MSACLPSQASSRAAMPGAFRHAADSGRQVDHAPALGDRELAEQEESRPRLGRDPVRIAAPGVEIGHLRGPRGLRGDGREVVLDLERAERLVLSQRHRIHESSPVGRAASVPVEELLHLALGPSSVSAPASAGRAISPDSAPSTRRCRSGRPPPRCCGGRCRRRRASSARPRRLCRSRA